MRRRIVRPGVMPDSMKVCTKCERVLPLPKFVRNSYSKDGYHCHCLECQRRTNEERKDKFVGNASAY